MSDERMDCDGGLGEEAAYQSVAEYEAWAKATIAARDAELAQLRAGLARANAPWSVKLDTPDPVDIYDRRDCKLIDTGHSDRVLIVSCPEVDAELAALRKQVEDQRKQIDALKVSRKAWRKMHFAYDNWHHIQPEVYAADAACRAAGVPVFVKQVGARPIGVCPCKADDGDPHQGCPACGGDGAISLHLHDPKGSNWNEWPEDLRVREFPNPPASAGGSSKAVRA